MEQKKKDNSAAAIFRREYYRQWRSKNRGRIKQYQESYWKRRAVEMEAEKSANADNQ